MDTLLVQEKIIYTYDYLINILGLKTFNSLLSNGILMISKRIADKDKEITEINYKAYTFNYVGIILTENKLIIVYPKYIRNIVEDQGNNYWKMKQLLNVINRYKEKQSIGIAGNSKFVENLWDSIEKQIFHYYSYGLYNAYQSNYEINGNGEIDWDYTIDSQLPILNKDIPIYTTLVTELIEKNAEYFITTLQQSVLKEISQKYEKVLEFLGINFHYDYYLEPQDLGSYEEILLRLYKERNIQFNDRNKALLNLLIDYFENKEKHKFENVHSIGSSAFKYVWEDVCRTVYGNDLKKKVGQLPGNVTNFLNNEKEKILGKVIKKSIWEFNNGIKEDGTRLKPDNVVISNESGNLSFNIYDAKYYSFSNIEETDSRPGIADITKQYLYQVAFNSVINKLQIHNVNNYFIIPSDKKNTEEIGTVKVPLFNEIALLDYTKRKIGSKCSNSKLAEVVIIEESSETIYKSYLNIE